jgi:hypothetical protein
MRAITVTTTVKKALRGLDDRVIFDVVAEGIENALGIGSSRLIFKTLEYVYNFKVTPISIRMGEFDGLLAKLVGETGYHHIVRSIFEEIAARRIGHNDESC